MPRAEDEDESRMRRHGLHGPFDPLQLVAFFAYTIFSLTFFLFHAPILIQDSHTGWVYVIGICAIWATFSIASYVMAATTPVHDPGIDDGVQYFYENYFLPPQEKTGCAECRAIVSKNSKHCWACNKCVVGFDHHCKWLNHCVGERNYRTFAVFLYNTSALMWVQTVLQWYVVINGFVHYDDFKGVVFRTFGANSAGSVIGFLVFSALLESLSLLPITHLCGLHIFLNWSKLSTYQWILINRERDNVEKEERLSFGLQADKPFFGHDCLMWRFRHGICMEGQEDRDRKKKEEREAAANSLKSAAAEKKSVEQNYGDRPQSTPRSTADTRSEVSEGAVEDYGTGSFRSGLNPFPNTSYDERPPTGSRRTSATAAHTKDDRVVQPVQGPTPDHQAVELGFEAHGGGRQGSHRSLPDSGGMCATEEPISSPHLEVDMVSFGHISGHQFHALDGTTRSHPETNGTSFDQADTSHPNMLRSPVQRKDPND